MDTYRPNYQKLPSSPLPPELPLLPREPPPPSWRGNGDLYRASEGFPSQHRIAQNEFTFQNNKFAPRYPQDFNGSNPQQPPSNEGRFEPRGNTRNNHRDNANLNRPRRGPYQQNRHGRGYKIAPSERPLLRRQNDRGDSPERMLGMNGGEKFMAAADISDSEEEPMDESASEANEYKVNIRGVSADAGVEQANSDNSEPPTKRRAFGLDSQDAKDAAMEPKWSNPDPYTVLPPVDEEQRKRKDVVKLIRKARKDVEDTQSRERNQVAANDDFISFGLDEDTLSDVPSSPGIESRVDYGASVKGAPLGPRGFSNVPLPHTKDIGAPGTSAHVPSATEMNAPPGLDVRPISATETSSQVILHTKIPHSQDRNDIQDDALGSRKRTHDDNIKANLGAAKRFTAKGKKGPGVKPTGSILPEWVPAPDIDATPWLQRTGTITANAGFRLHKEVCDFYEFVRPQRFEQKIRQELLSRLQRLVNDRLPNSSVHCFGSFAAGLYLPTADMDVVIISKTFHMSGRRTICQSSSQMYRFGDYLENSGLAARGSVNVIVHAKVPIIKFIDGITAIRVDVSFENNTGIDANTTFAMWKAQFPAMPMIVTIIKQFLIMRGLNEVMTGGLGGFSVTCLVTSLLQNMPRVQTGDLIPEQHLGEVLVEFLDYYGNQFDISSTGLVMNPPGYFDKQTQTRPSQQIYRANRAARLAILDPNNPDNDISGGSREVMLIFQRFSEAHAQILAAMRTDNRPSFLDIALAGNYESFIAQRNLLLDLYKERWGKPEGIPDRYQLLPHNQPVPPPLTDPAGQSPRHQNLEVGKNLTKENVRPAASSNKPPSVHNQPSQPKPGLPRASKGDFDRATALKKAHPHAKNIPASLTKAEKNQLVNQFTRSSNPRNPTSKTQPSQKAPAGNAIHAKHGAGSLTMLHPQRAELTPREPSRTEPKAFTGTQTTGRQSQTLNSVKPDHWPESLPPRPAISAGEPRCWAQYQPSGDQFVSVNARAVDHPPRPSDKMAPLSAERWVEVAQNWGGISKDYPIDLD